MGVSNCGVHDLELEVEFRKGNGGEIRVGQWELHPWLARPGRVDWCREWDVVIEVYCPLILEQRFDGPILQPMIKKYNKGAAQNSIKMEFAKVSRTLCMSISLGLTLDISGLRTTARKRDHLKDRV